jgi:pimeloyl-ACP methyl ester carboxylesterase
MNPYFFGTNERRLFGVYEAAQQSLTGRGVVLCHPWGAEYIYAYRVMRLLSKMLSANGFHTLRFDYFGTGDSDGEAASGDVSGWEADIQSAIDELKDTTGATQVSLVGLRLGATLAANVAIRSVSEISSLVLWDPIVSGAEYLREMQLTDETGWFRMRPARSTERGRREIKGFVLTESMATALRQVDLTGVATELPPRSLVVTSQPLASHQYFQSALQQRNNPVVLEHIDGPLAWIEWPIDHPQAGTLPVKVLQRIVEWL